MNNITKSVIAFVFSAAAFGGAQAAAENQPAYAPETHDQRSYNAAFYNDGPVSDHYQTAAHRGDRYNRRDRYDRGYDRYSRRRPHSRVVHRETYRTKYRARIVLVEEIYWTRSGRQQLVCSVLVKGPEAYYVPHRRLRRIANRDCSPRARIQYL